MKADCDIACDCKTQT